MIIKVHVTPACYVTCVLIEPSEYCELEQFRPRCPPDKVIVITEARYGLVSLGRCLQADFGYVGCFADVVDYIGAKCSGRRACQQQVPDRFMKEAAARCRPEFNGFLHAAYKCIDGWYTYSSALSRQCFWRMNWPIKQYICSAGICFTRFTRMTSYSTFLFSGVWVCFILDMLLRA